MGFHVLVLAGGSGTRLWPLSRAAIPKHLLPLGPGGQTLLRATVDRVAPIAASVWVVTAADQADTCLAALAGSAASVRIIAEPSARGTGPAIGLAVAQIVGEDPEAIIASVHADADIGDDDAYRAAVIAVAGWAAVTDGLATVGITPTHAATGLGYIALGAGLDPATWRPPSSGAAGGRLSDAAARLPAAASQGFVEKPDLLRAQEFVRDGRHLWNLGMFAWPAVRLLAELEAADPALAEVVREVATAQARGDLDLAGRLYTALEPIALEPLVLERTERLTVVRASFPWSDLGSWADLAATRSTQADTEGNLLSGDVVAVGCTNTVVESRGGRTVAVIGTDGLVVVDTGDALLVMPASASQRVKEVVERLRASGRSDLV